MRRHTRRAEAEGGGGGSDASTPTAEPTPHPDGEPVDTGYNPTSPLVIVSLSHNTHFLTFPLSLCDVKAIPCTRHSTSQPAVRSATADLTTPR